MERQTDSGLFGEIDAPPLSPGRLTAFYKANAWSNIQKAWNISMYPTLPGTKEHLDMPTAMLTSASMQGQAAPLQGDPD